MLAQNFCLRLILGGVVLQSGESLLLRVRALQSILCSSPGYVQRRFDYSTVKQARLRSRMAGNRYEATAPPAALLVIVEIIKMCKARGVRYYTAK